MTDRKHTVVFDLESAVDFKTHCYADIRNVTAGISPGELMLFSAGRHTGKSYLNHLFRTLNMASAPPFVDVDTATVDGEVWHTVRCNAETAAWVKSQNPKSIYEHQSNYNTWTGVRVFDVDDKVYTLLRVGFSV